MKAPAQARPAATVARLVDSARGTGGRLLDPAARAELEPRFGHDFGRVRVHHDAPADAAARAVGAAAFTVGDDLFFSALGGRPESRRGLLLHELAHVAQCRAGTVGGGPGPGPYRMSRPGDPWEAAAGTAAAAALTSPAGPTMAAAQSSRHAGPPVIQRFLAGEDGHGAVEEKALRDAGLSKAEYRRTYYGNWLRDYSQQVGSPAIHFFAQAMALGEFGRVPSDDDYGGYLPSEHVDNPAGGESEEATLPGGPSKPMPARPGSRLSSEQQTWLDYERSHPETFEAASRTSHLPTYIERGKEHVRWKLRDAARDGRNPVGLLSLGNGLHAVEDYFAHSNFVEVALAEILPPDDPVMGIVHGYVGVDPLKLGPDGDGGIVTGTSTKGGGDTVGKAELIKTEFRDHELVRNIATGGLRGIWRRASTLFGGALGGVAAGAAGLLGGVLGLFGGAANGLVDGWRKGHGFWSRLGGAVAGLFGGAGKGAAHGLVRAGGAGLRAGMRAGRALGDLADTGPGHAVFGALGAIASSPFALLESLARPIVHPIAEHYMKKGTLATTREGTPGPSHSQIAKDDPGHPLHNAAARLAYLADLSIARSMVDVWAGDARVESAQAKVDVFMAEPRAGAWWKADLRAMAQRVRARAAKRVEPG